MKNKLYIKYVLLIVVLLVGVPLTFNHVSPIVAWVLALIWAAIMVSQIQKDIKQFNNHEDEKTN